MLFLFSLLFLSHFAFFFLFPFVSSRWSMNPLGLWIAYLPYLMWTDDQMDIQYGPMPPDHDHIPPLSNE